MNTKSPGQTLHEAQMKFSGIEFDWEVCTPEHKAQSEYAAQAVLAAHGSEMEWEEFTGTEAMERGYRKEPPLQFRHWPDTEWHNVEPGCFDAWSTISFYRRPKVQPIEATDDHRQPKSN